MFYKINRFIDEYFKIMVLTLFVVALILLSLAVIELNNIGDSARNLSYYADNIHLLR